MILQSIYIKILRRSFFRGQDRIFNFLFKRKYLQLGQKTVSPLMGNFKIICDTNTWIGAKIVYNGDYEPTLKKIFKAQINLGDTILDIGANIGLHTLFFSELTGSTGKVISFEPVPSNYKKLIDNIKLNNYKNVTANNIALGDKNEILNIFTDEKSTNPGSFNLFDRSGNTKVNCKIGDEVIKEEKINFIKIDVEGYEGFAINGLIKNIAKHKPKIIFEYDLDYQIKSGLPPNYIFDLLSPLNYRFFSIGKNGLHIIDNFDLIN